MRPARRDGATFPICILVDNSASRHKSALESTTRLPYNLRLHLVECQTGTPDVRVTARCATSMTRDYLTV